MLTHNKLEKDIKLSLAKMSSAMDKALMAMRLKMMKIPLLLCRICRSTDQRKETVEA